MTTPTDAIPTYDALKADYTARRDKLKKTTQEFEAVFVGQMLKGMRKCMTGNALFGGSQDAKTFQEMLDDATAQNLSKNGSFGLAKVLYKRLEKTLPPDPDALLKNALKIAG